MPYSAIRAAPPFSGIDDEKTFRALTDVAVERRLGKNVTLLKEGERPRFLQLVAEGSVERYGTHNGYTATFEINEAPVTLDLCAVIGDGPALASARTLSPARVFTIPADKVRAAFTQNAAFARAVAESLADSQRTTMSALKAEKLRTSIERLANWILKVHQIQGTTGRVTIHFHKHTLASQLGMAPENLSRNLARLSKYGVRSSGRHIYVENSRALETFAKPNVLMDS